ncbi:MAG: glycosyltransferase, partial [Elusimicrobiaceae bacterium]|nr:glycosyltransferase [Elusimicrobiaceae bacterium]
MKKLKVLQIPYGGLGNGGVASVILSIVKMLHPYFDFTCIVFDRLEASETICQRYSTLHRVKFCYVNTNTVYRWISIVLRPLIFYWSIYNLCKKEHFHVIHCHNGYDQWPCLLAAKHAGVKIRIAHSHNTKAPVKLSFFKRLYRYYAGKLINRYATLRVGCSRQACLDFFGDVPARVVYNAVDLTKFDIKKHTSFQNKRFIHVGRFCYQKNQLFLLEVFDRVR